MQVRVLVVDDQEFMRELIKAALADRYQVVEADSGEACLAAVDELAPDLILLDVNMAGMSGYDTCRRLREHAVAATTPIIFVSAAVSQKDRIAGFEAGGDDYVTKPIDESLLIDRIELHLRRRRKNKLLEAQARESMDMAMEAMTFSGELGLLLQLMKETAEILDYKALMAKVDEVCCHFGLSCCYLVLDGDNCRYFNCEPDSVGAQVLYKCRNEKKIFDFGSRTIFSEARVSMLVKNMPLDDDKLYGRLKDHLAILCTIADQHVHTLQVTMHLQAERQRMLGDLVGLCENNLQQIHEQVLSHSEMVQGVMQSLIEQLESRLMTLGLEEDQEAKLIALVGEASERLEAGESFAGEMEQGMMEVMAGLNKLYDDAGRSASC